MKKVLLLIFISGTYGCGNIEKEKTPLEFKSKEEVSIPDRTEESKDEEVKVRFEELKQVIFKPYRCTNCHGWTNREKEILKRVVPGDISDSSLYEVMRSGMMPIGGKAVTTKDLELLERYINQLKK